MKVIRKFFSRIRNIYQPYFDNVLPGCFRSYLDCLPILPNIPIYNVSSTIYTISCLSRCFPTNLECFQSHLQVEKVTSHTLYDSKNLYLGTEFVKRMQRFDSLLRGHYRRVRFTIVSLIFAIIWILRATNITFHTWNVFSQLLSSGGGFVRDMRHFLRSGGAE